MYILIYYIIYAKYGNHKKELDFRKSFFTRNFHNKESQYYIIYN